MTETSANYDNIFMPRENRNNLMLASIKKASWNLFIKEGLVAVTVLEGILKLVLTKEIVMERTDSKRCALCTGTRRPFRQILQN